MDHVCLPENGIQSFFDNENESSLFFRQRNEYSLRDL